MTKYDEVVSDDIMIDESEVEIVGFESCDGCGFMVGVEETSSIIDDQIVCFDMDSDLDDDLTLEV